MQASLLEKKKKSGDDKAKSAQEQTEAEES